MNDTRGDAARSGSGPAAEAGRLFALRRMSLLDTPPSEEFDRVTRLAGQTLDVPVALVSLVDESRQWFKSRFGTDASETPREISFCTYAIREAAYLHVPDATLDARFAGNPLVTGAPFIRAYLGFPLRTRSGHAVGAFCLIDTSPREFTAREIAATEMFAAIVEDLIHAQERDAEATSTLQRLGDQARLFSDTFEDAPVGIVHTALSGQLVRVNRRVIELLGYSAQELEAISFIDITHPDDVPRNTELFMQLLSGKIDDYRLEKRFLRSDGEYVWMDLAVRIHRAPSGRPDFMISVIEDASARKRIEDEYSTAIAQFERGIAGQTAKLDERNEAMRSHVKKILEAGRIQRETEQRLRVMTDSIPAMIGYWNSDLVCEFANAAYFDWFGLKSSEIVGMSMRQLLGEQLFLQNEPFARGALAGKPQHFERQLIKQGVELSHTDARYIPDQDEFGRTRGFFVLITDVTAFRAAKHDLEFANARLKSENMTDVLTGLANRRVFNRRSDEAAWQFRERGVPYGLVLIDLDDFKHVNDRFGHDGGDDLLRAVGRLLKDQMRNHHEVATRLGGEEFALLCQGVENVAGLVAFAERIREKLSREVVRSAKGAIQISGSFGIAWGDARDEDSKAVYARADRALYRAKAAGKNCVLCADVEGTVHDGAPRLRAV